MCPRLVPRLFTTKECFHDNYILAPSKKTWRLQNELRVRVGSDVQDCTCRVREKRGEKKKEGDGEGGVCQNKLKGTGF